MRFISISALSLATLATCASAATLRPYYIGNSLSIGATYWVDGITQMAASRGDVVSKGHHFRTGVGLQTIWNDYTANTLGNTWNASPSYFDTALTGHDWDVVTLQPFSDPAADEAVAAGSFIDMTQSRPGNSDTRFFIYASRTGFPGAYTPGTLDYQTGWNADYAGGAVGDRSSAAYFNAVLTQVRNAQPDATIGMIPVGHVVAALDLKVQANEVPDLTSIEALYSDNVHASGIGQYVEATTFYAVMFQSDPRGLAIPSGYASVVTPAMAAVIQETVWQVVNDNASLTLVPEPTAAIATSMFCGLLLRRRR